jgi:hypothetical protein
LALGFLNWNPSLRPTLAIGLEYLVAFLKFIDKLYDVSKPGASRGFYTESQAYTLAPVVQKMLHS